MPHATHPPESDRYLALPEAGANWDPAMLYTYYHGMHIPEERIGAYIYFLGRPTFGACQGGVLIFQGDQNYDPLDMAYMDYEMTMPWPTVDETSLTTDNGLCIEFVELGRKNRLTYASPNGEASFDLIAEALTPLYARGHIIPGEDLHGDPAMSPGGTEQMMRVTGELTLRGKRYDVDCFNPRDRSWRQIRTESRHRRAELPTLPPVGWTPMYFGPDLIFNSAGYVTPSTNPNWAGLYDVDPAKPSHYFAWMMVDGEDVPVTKVVRTVHEVHPVLYSAQRQEVEVEVEGGRTFRFYGETTAMCNAVAWPNAAIRVGTSHWKSDDGRECDNTYQEMWFDDIYMRTMNERAAHRIYRPAAATAAKG
jgi:hypothetical protein